MRFAARLKACPDTNLFQSKSSVEVSAGSKEPRLACKERTRTWGTRQAPDASC
jgi:hypothetical protein